MNDQKNDEKTQKWMNGTTWSDEKKSDLTSSSFLRVDKRRKFVHYYKKNKHEIIFI